MPGPIRHRSAVGRRNGAGLQLHQQVPHVHCHVSWRSASSGNFLRFVLFFFKYKPGKKHTFFLSFTVLLVHILRSSLFPLGFAVARVVVKEQGKNHLTDCWSWKNSAPPRQTVSIADGSTNCARTTDCRAHTAGKNKIFFQESLKIHSTDKIISFHRHLFEGKREVEQAM